MDNEIVTTSNTVKCLNCGTEFEGSFCPRCGQKATTGRFTMKFLFQNLLVGIFGNDGSVWFTLKKLFSRPGTMIKEILDGKRKSYFSPFPMLFCVLAFYILLFTLTGTLDNTRVELQGEDFVICVNNTNYVLSNHQLSRFLDAYWNHYTTSTLLTLPLIVVAARACFGKKNRKRYYWAEYCVPIVYAMVLTTLFRCLTCIVFTFAPEVALFLKLFTWVIMAVSIAFCFRKMAEMSFVKSFWRSLLTMLLYHTMILFLIIIGVIVVAKIQGTVTIDA